MFILDRHFREDIRRKHEMAMAVMAGSGVEAKLDPIDRFECPVCKEVYKNPYHISCGYNHT